jgi:hypothetical protein
VADAAEVVDWLLDPHGGGVQLGDLLFWTHPKADSESTAVRSYLENPTPWPSGPPDFARPPRAFEIKLAANELAKSARNANIDRLYVFFAGHGVQTNPLPYDVEPQNCFVAGDYAPSLRSESLVPCEDLRRGMMRIGPAEVVLFVDCCRNELPITVPAPALGWDQFPNNGVNIRCGIGLAADPGFVAYETPIKNPTRGAFSKLLVCGLRNLRSKGVLTADQLEAYLLSGINALVAPNDQRPSVDVIPKRERVKLVLAQGPALGPLPELVIDLSKLAAGTRVVLRDPDLNVLQTLTADAEPKKFPAPIGGYSLDTPTGPIAINHLGPDPTNVTPT